MINSSQIQQSAIVVHALAENAQLRQKVKELKQHLMNSKLETAELYKKFGSLADNWQQTVNELKATLEDQQVSYEERISGLEKTNKQLKEENEELRTMVKELYAKLDELKGQERQLKIGQIGFALEELVAEILFPGKSRAEKRQRYGVELKNVKKKVGKIEDDDLKHEAQARLATIPPELFEPWVVGIIGDIKKMRLSPAHPPLGSYDEITGEIRILYKDDQYKCEDLITVVNHLKNLYDKQKLPFGGEPGGMYVQFVNLNCNDDLALAVALQSSHKNTPATAYNIIVLCLGLICWLVLIGLSICWLLHWISVYVYLTVCCKVFI